MKKLIQSFAWTICVLIVSVAALTAMFWSKRTIWPEFPQSKDFVPQVVVKVEPDFGWRLADRIPVTLFIKQKADVNIDLNSLAVEGDFEFSGSPTVYSRDNKDGSKYVRIDLMLQSFAVQPKLTMKANMSYLVKGEPDPKLISLPGVELYTSRTWDGRNQRQDGPMAVEHGWHFWTTGLALVLGLTGSLLCGLYLLKIRKEAAEEAAAPLTGRALARQDFELVWQRIQARQDGDEDYKEIARILRRLYRIETRVTWEIPMELGDNHPHLKQILGINKLCDRVIYKDNPLTGPEKAEIRRLFDEITLPAKKLAEAAAVQASSKA
jgi:hypothetical protein